MTVLTSAPAPALYDPRREAPPPEAFETVDCYACGSSRHRPLIEAEEDLTGKPGRFHFVRCERCGLSFQNPRLRLESIKAYYDEEYLAHRKRGNFGPLTPLVNWAMQRHDVRKRKLIARCFRPGPQHHVLDVGCGAGTFLDLLRRRDGCQTVGVDFADLSHSPAFEHSELRVGLLTEQDFGDRRFDLITMWHFLEHDYDPPAALRAARDWLAPGGQVVVEVPRLDSRSFDWFQDRWPGLQAPQHTVLFDAEHLRSTVRDAGLEVVEWLPWGAFPAYFYLYAGRAFRRLRGEGLDLDRAAVSYFLGQVLLSPMLLFEKQLNLAMQTVICRRPDASRTGGSTS